MWGVWSGGRILLWGLGDRNCHELSVWPQTNHLLCSIRLSLRWDKVLWSIVLLRCFPSCPVWGLHHLWCHHRHADSGFARALSPTWNALPTCSLILKLKLMSHLLEKGFSSCPSSHAPCPPSSAVSIASTVCAWHSGHEGPWWCSSLQPPWAPEGRGLGITVLRLPRLQQEFD